MSNDLVFSHDEFHFEAPYTRDIIIPLLLENHSTQSIVYKVKVLDPRRYTVKPTSAVIAPGSSITVQITFLGLSEDRVPGFLITKQKFKVQYRLLDSSADPSQLPSVLISKPETGGPVQEKRIICRFDTDTTPKSTSEHEYTPHTGETPGTGTNEQQPAQGCCDLRRCLLYFLVAFFVLLLAIGLQVWRQNT